MSTNTIEQKDEQNEKPQDEDVFDKDVSSIETQPSNDTTNLDAPEPAFVQPRQKLRFRDKLRRLLKSKKFWAFVVLSLFTAVVALWFIQPTRAWMVSVVGLRTNLTIIASTRAEDKQPAAKLKNVTISVNGHEYITDNEGKVAIHDQPYGQTTIIATKHGYEEVQVQRFLDFDPFFHKFGGKEADEAARNVDVNLVAVGVPVSFQVLDWLSGEPIANGTFQAGDLKVQSGADGIVSFKAPPADDNKLTIRSEFGGAYIDKSFDVSLQSPEESTVVTFIPAGKHYYISARDGARNVYASNLDGSEPQLIIPGTGKEIDTTALVVAPNGKYGILASTRDGVRNKQNTLLQRLYIVDLERKLLKQVDEGAAFYLAGWSDEMLVYTQTAANPDNKAKQTKLKSVNASSAAVTDLSNAYGFDSISVSLGRTLFIEQTLASNDSQVVTSTAKRADIRSGVTKELARGVMSDIVQTSLDQALFQTQSDQKWHQYNFNTDVLQDSAAPTGSQLKVFLGANPANSQQLIVDRIDGAFTLITKAVADGAEKQLYGAGSITGPIRWINNNAIVFRIVSAQETADYAISPNGGEPKKITNITANANPPGVATDINIFKRY